MLYRHHVSFAVGHGVSVHAETLPGDPTCAVRLSTCVAPSYDVPTTTAPTPDELPALNALVLDMKTLAELESHDLPPALQPLVDTYSAWIAEQEQRLLHPTPDLAEYCTVAAKALQQCRQTLARIQSGIAMLQTSREGARAFALMNRAMWQQRIQSSYAEERRKNNTGITLADLDQPQNRSWQPFQLAFILLNLPALTDLQHPDRSTDASAIADLLWFPTGGGKTEAYLGLTVYTLAIRLLLYTAAADSEGTLGGLVSLGKPETLGWHIDGALEEMQHCASDPFCAEHSSREDHTLHEAACHACMFIPETSCERGNKCLDRSLLVPTVKRDDLAFFPNITDL